MQPQNQVPEQQSAQPPQPVVPGPAPEPTPVVPEPAPQPEVFGSGAEPAEEEAEAEVTYEEGGLEDEEYAEGEGEGEEFDGEAVDLSQPVSWQAQEYIHQEKSGLWFVLFGIIIFVLMALAILLMKSWTFAVLLVVIAVVILFFAKRPPRIMSYSLSNKGLHIGDQLHTFSDFRAFGVIHDGQEYSIMLIPTKRFLPGVSVYFPEEAGEQIVDALGSRLPMQELHLDIVDKIVRALRLG
jgi:hypothetical protein